MQTPIVIHNESGYIRAGLSSDDTPKVIFRPNSVTGTNPLEKDVIVNWEAMKKVWKHTFDQLGVNPANHPVLMTETPLNFKRNREETVRILFETFNVPAVYLAMDSVLALYDCDRTTGVVLNLGEEVSHVVPIYEGFALLHAILRIDIGAVNLKSYLAKLLSEQGYSLSPTANNNDLEQIKEKLCYIALDYDREQVNPQTFTTSTGKTIKIGKERFQVPEALLQPSFVDMEAAGIHETIYLGICKCDLDMRSMLYKNIVVVGSNTKFQGLDTRLQKELITLARAGANVNITVSPEPENAVWRGGDRLAPLLDEYNSWITKDEYTQYGATIVHRRGRIYSQRLAILRWLKTRHLECGIPCFASWR
jgi:actin beta/gamma 1